MFYLVSKVFAYALTPAGWLFATLLLALSTKRPYRRRQWLITGLGVFWLFGNAFLVNEALLAWEYPPAPVPTNSTGVAVVLTGGMVNVDKELPASPADRDRYVLGREADRAGQALYLYKRGAVRHILISGGTGNLPFGRASLYDEGQMTARFLQLAGVPAAAISLESSSRNTHENALFSARLLRSRFRTNGCVLVTSATHMRRAAACFCKEGVLVTPFPGDFLGRRRSWLPGEWLLPNELAFADAFFLIREVFGYVAYRLTGYV